MHSQLVCLSEAAQQGLTMPYNTYVNSCGHCHGKMVKTTYCTQSNFVYHAWTVHFGIFSGSGLQESRISPQSQFTKYTRNGSRSDWSNNSIFSFKSSPLSVTSKMADVYVCH